MCLFNSHNDLNMNGNVAINAILNKYARDSLNPKYLWQQQ
jgi:hypothetical protein